MVLNTTRNFTFVYGILLLTVFQAWEIAADVSPLTNPHLYNSGILDTAPHQAFHTVNYSLPLFLKTKMDERYIDSSQYIFFTPYQDGGLGGPMIYDAKTLSPVYADMSFTQVGDLRVQRYLDHDYLVFSSLNHPSGYSHCRIYDSSYRLAFTVNAVGIAHELANLHDCQLTKDGTALITVDERIPWDLTRVGGAADGRIIDTMLQEIDIATGKLVFQWRATDHVDISESFSPVGNSTWWDFCHFNSFEKVS